MTTSTERVQNVTTAQQDKPLPDVKPKRLYSMRDRFVIVGFEMSRYSNSHSDASVKEEIANNKGAESNMISFSKKLLTKGVVSRVQQHYSRVRDMARVPRAQTDGSVRYDPMRYAVASWGKEVLVPIGRLADMVAEYKSHESAMEAEIEAMRPEWDSLLREAEEASDQLFDSDLMPTFNDFANAWSMRMNVMALPEYDPRISIDDDQRNDLIEQVRQSTADQLTRQLTDSWKSAASSMLTSIKYAAAVLGNDAAGVQELNGTKGGRKSKRAVQISDSLFDNLNNQLRTVRSLAEAAGDTGLLDLTKDVASTLGSLTADNLRKNPAQRAQMASVANQLAARAETQINNTSKEVDSAVDDLSAFA